MIRKTVKVLVSVALLTTLSMAKKEALLVGVDDYRGTKDDFGKGIGKDITKMKALFEKWGFHVTVLFNKDSVKLDSYLNSYSQNLKENDKFIFYYTGHGYHQPDEVGGDETEDHEDEVLVLSDGRENYPYVDDALNGYLNSMKATKLVLFDSCHSGTAFKAFGDDKPMAKSLSKGTVLLGKVISKAFKPQDSELKNGDYIVFSASQDNETSLATSNGSLFTNAFYKQFNSSKGLNTKLDESIRRIGIDIVNYCNATKSDVHHAKLSTSRDVLQFTTLNKFLTPKVVSNRQVAQPQTQRVESPRATKSLTLMGKTTFGTGELLDFKIDTHGNSGYLTIFSIEKGEPYIMYQSSEPKRGVFNFKDDFNINPKIECYKFCTNCQTEKSTVYVAFSAQPIRVRFNRQSKAIDTQPTVNSKGYREQRVQSFKTVIEKFETTIY